MYAPSGLKDKVESRFSDKIDEYLLKRTKNKIVIDLACGNFAFRPPSGWCSKFQGVDIHQPNHKFITFTQLDLSEPTAIDKLPQADIALVIWPVNWRGIRWGEILSKYAEVIYVGINSDGTTCGDPALWDHLIHRTIREIVNEPRNILIHYSKEKRIGNYLATEEYHGCQAWMDYLTVYKYTEQAYIHPSEEEKNRYANILTNDRFIWKGNSLTVDMKLNERQEAIIQNLKTWHENSAKSEFPLGVPLEPTNENRTN